MSRGGKPAKPILDRELDEIELPEPMVAALQRLKRKTVKGIVALRECDLWDALDLDPSLDEATKQGSIDHLRFVLNVVGLELNKEGRFESFEEMASCVVAAAQELSVPVERGVTHRARPMVKLTIVEHRGDLTFEESVNWLGLHDFEQMTPFRETHMQSAPTQAAAATCYAVARNVLRRAQALAEERRE